MNENMGPPPGNQNQQGPQVTADTIRNAKTLKCEDCGGMIFEEKILIKTISALLSPSGKQETAPIPVMICNSCGKVPRIFDPQNILPEIVKCKIKKDKDSSNKEK